VAASSDIERKRKGEGVAYKNLEIRGMKGNWGGGRGFVKKQQKRKVPMRPWDGVVVKACVVVQGVGEVIKTIKTENQNLCAAT